MIIITNIILYFIQIRHTDDFPSTGTWLESIMTIRDISIIALGLVAMYQVIYL